MAAERTIAPSAEYARHISGTVTLDSRGSGWRGLRMLWHTQATDVQTMERPTTGAHQLVMFCAGEECGTYSYENRPWEPYRKRRHEWFIAPAYENHIRWRLDAQTAQREPATICRIHLCPATLEEAAQEYAGRRTPAFSLPHRSESAVLGRVITGWSLAMVATVPASAFVADRWGWRTASFIVAGLGGCALLGFRRLPELTPRSSSPGAPSRGASHPGCNTHAGRVGPFSAAHARNDTRRTELLVTLESTVSRARRRSFRLTEQAALSHTPTRPGMRRLWRR